MSLATSEPPHHAFERGRLVRRVGGTRAFRDVVPGAHDQRDDVSNAVASSAMVNAQSAR